MSSGHQRIKWRRNIAEKFNRLSRVHERYRQTTDDRQTDARRHIANVNMSSRSLKTGYGIYHASRSRNPGNADGGVWPLPQRSCDAWMQPAHLVKGACRLRIRIALTSPTFFSRFQRRRRPVGSSTSRKVKINFSDIWFQLGRWNSKVTETSAVHYAGFSHVSSKAASAARIPEVDRYYTEFHDRRCGNRKKSVGRMCSACIVRQQTDDWQTA